MVSPVAADSAGFFPRRRRFRRKVLLFSFSCAVVALLIGGIVFALTSIYQPLRDAQGTHRKASDRIRCGVEECDITGVINDRELEPPDYVLHKDSRFLLYAPPTDLPGFSLNYSDTTFAGRFETPASVRTQDGARWRLYSEKTVVGGKPVVVMVGYIENAPWKMDLPPPPAALVDGPLKEQVALIKGALLRNPGGQILRGSEKGTKADAYEIVDLTDRAILNIAT